ncbi:ArgS-related anticodon-binding protein NrtL [Streptomyces sp. NPDC008222]|uniref:ArgS-related anticodon-binding protein NrtL n=1 Tax=Streptomyces sp. NPDC008222 TaxID=3364820 RepID=UPI0036E7BDDA
MTPVELSRTVLCAVRRAVEGGELTVAVPTRAVVAPPGPGGRGDYATNIALQLARPAGRAPLDVAEILRPLLQETAGVADVEITGPGFLNIHLERATATAALVREILQRSGGMGMGISKADSGFDVDSGISNADSGIGADTRINVDSRIDVDTGIASGTQPIRGAQTTPATPTPAETPPPYGHTPTLVGQVIALRIPYDIRAEVVADTLVRIIATQGGRAEVHHVRSGEAVDLRPVPAPEDPAPLGPDAARWALLHPAAHDRPRITADHLLQRESNPLFRVRYAHARARALGRNAGRLGLDAVPGDVADAAPLTHALGAYPHALTQAAAHRAPDRLARHLVAVADGLLAFQHTVLPLGDEKPSAAHRARLALAEAAGTVLAGGLSLLGISAPDYL